MFITCSQSCDHVQIGFHFDPSWKAVKCNAQHGSPLRHSELFGDGKPQKLPSLSENHGVG